MAVLKTCKILICPRTCLAYYGYMISEVMKASWARLVGGAEAGVRTGSMGRRRRRGWERGCDKLDAGTALGTERADAPSFLSVMARHSHSSRSAALPKLRASIYALARSQKISDGTSVRLHTVRSSFHPPFSLSSPSGTPTLRTRPTPPSIPIARSKTPALARTRCHNNPGRDLLSDEPHRSGLISVLEFHEGSKGLISDTHICNQWRSALTFAPSL